MINKNSYVGTTTFSDQVKTESVPSISAKNILADQHIDISEMLALQEDQMAKAATFTPHFAHHAFIELVRHKESGLFLIKKTFGSGDRKIPVHVAYEMQKDYRTHEERLRSLGINTAGNYGLSVSRDGESGIIVVYQMFFPSGTVLDLLTDDVSENSDVTAAAEALFRDTVVPVLLNGRRASSIESAVFLDSAPKNVAYCMSGGKMTAYYIDFFIPRIRTKTGEIKTYPNYHPHIRPEGEMRERFFTMPGIIKNVLRKTKINLAGRPERWELFSRVAQRQLEPYLKEYFSGKSVDQIAGVEAIGTRNIVLIGMRGGGKTTTAKLLAERLGKERIEMDDLIVARASMSIPAIVQKFGWEHYRDLESQLAQEISHRDNLVISTGGGAILRADNVAALKRHGVCVLLAPPIKVSVSRIGNDPNRPALTNLASQEEEMERIWSERKELYEAAADEIIDTSDKDPGEVVDLVMRRFNISI